MISKEDSRKVTEATYPSRWSIHHSKDGELDCTGTSGFAGHNFLDLVCCGFAVLSKFPSAVYTRHCVQARCLHNHWVVLAVTRGSIRAQDLRYSRGMEVKDSRRSSPCAQEKDGSIWAATYSSDDTRHEIASFSEIYALIFSS